MLTDTLALFPITAAISNEGRLSVAGHDLTTLAQAWGTPLYLYDAATVRRQAGLLQGWLKQHYPGPSQVTYAAKAYFSLGWARQINALGLGVDVVSAGELQIARKGGFPPGHVHLHGNNKSTDELQAALDWGVQSIVVDSLEELDVLESLAEKSQQTARIWLRLSPGLDVNTHAYVQTAHHASKFGLPVDDGQAARAIKAAQKSRWLRLTGLHTHLGSQIFEIEPYIRAVEVICRLAEQEGFIPEELSPGGGWGVPYLPGQPEHSTGELVNAVCQRLVDECARNRWPMPTLVLEPGRWLSAQAGVALYTIGTHKISNDGTHFVAIDGGLADNPRPALYQAQYTALVANKANQAAVQTVNLAGRFCESGDQLIFGLPLPDVQRGDVVAVPVSGAYQLSMASNYNLVPRPAVLWLEEGHVSVLQKRDQPAESGWWVD
jgi:diaminopimelate decarboxylase